MSSILTPSDITPWKFPYSEEIGTKPTLETHDSSTCVTDVKEMASFENLNSVSGRSLVQDYIVQIGRDGKITVCEQKRRPMSRASIPIFINSPKMTERYEQISEIFNKLTSKVSATTIDDIEILYQGKVTSDAKSKLGLDSYYDGVEDLIAPIQSSATDPDSEFNYLPQSFMHRMAPLLDHRSLTRCREVCKNWSKNISCSKTFIDTTIFVMGCTLETLELIKRCRMTQVKWENIKCQLMPCPEFYAAKGYQEKYIMNKLVQGPKGYFTAFIKYIILDNFEIQKENLVKWLSSCFHLTKLELRGCTFKKCKISWTKESLQKVTDKLTYISATGMSITNLVDFGKLILLLTKSLNHLEISQRGVDPYSMLEIPAVRTKTLESDLITLLASTVDRNVKTLRTLSFSLEMFESTMLQAKLFQKIGKSGVNLQEFSFALRKAEDQTYCLNVDSLGFNVNSTLQDILKTSPTLKKLHIPFLLVDLSDSDDISWIFPSTVSDIGMQVNSPMLQNQSKLGIRKRLILRKATFYEKLFVQQDLIDFRKCFPWIYELEINSSQMNDNYLQSLIEHLPHLVSLTLSQVQEITDVGVVGIQMDVLKKFVADLVLLPEDLNMEKLPRFGKPLCLMTDLKTFKCRGNIKITDVGITNGFVMKQLEVLELSGTPLHISPTGLQSLATNCPNLKSVVLQLNREAASIKGVQDFYTQLAYLQPRATQIDLY